MTFELTDKQSDLASRILSSPAKHSLIYGGSRSGKTFLYCWAIAQRAIKAPGSRHVVFRKHNVAVKQAVGMDTLRKVMKLAFPEVPFKWYEQDGYFKLPNDSEIWLAGLDDKERVEKVLGKEYATMYFNEASEIPYQSYIIAQTRLSQKVERYDGRILSLKSYVDLNPTTRHHWTYRLYVDGIEPESNQPVEIEDYVWGVANPRDNADNLTEDYLKALKNLPERARRRFWEGEFSGDAENALWRRDMLRRVNAQLPLPEFRRVVVAIDPAVTNEQGSDETGIIVAGLGMDGYGYVLSDDSGKYRPEEWAKKAINAYHAYSADRIVAEVNNGGDMVESVIRAQAKNISYQSVRATRGKAVRAEPIAALYERGKVFHVGEFPALEDQMCFVAGTMIETARGQIPIEHVVAGDFAMTRAGFRKVKIACETGIVYTVVDIESSDGRKITCTENHPIFAGGRFVSAKNVQAGDCLLGSPNWASTDGLSLGGGAGTTGCVLATFATPKGRFSIGRFGRRITAPFLTGSTSTMSTVIQATTALKTSTASVLQSITQSILREAGMETLPSGSAGSKHGRTGSGQAQNVHSVAMNLKRHSLPALSTALMRVARGQGLLRRLLRGSASNAGPDIQQETRGESIAVRRVTTRHITPESVYNLQVDGPPEYFANGILVHNCTLTIDFDPKTAGFSPDRTDALVWAMTALFPDMVRDNSTVDIEFEGL